MPLRFRLTLGKNKVSQRYLAETPYTREDGRDTYL